LSKINVGKCRYVGLSATIGDFTLAKEFFGQPESTKVLIDNTPKPNKVEIKYFPSEPLQLSVDLLKDLYKKTRGKKALVFANTRTLVENASVKLSQISELVGGHSNYFSHHSSVDRDIKEYAAFFAKHSRLEPFTICCTSTLELGIDIGTVDTVVQIHAPHNVCSMVQRMGRSGRGQISTSELTIYATNKWDLLQALACWRLFEKGVLDTSERIKRPYDILLHQMLSIVKERTEIGAEELVHELHENIAFRDCDIDAAKMIIRKLVDDDMLEEIDGKLIVGLKAEKYFDVGELYTVFRSSFEYDVLFNDQVIGSLCPLVKIVNGTTIFLAAKKWKIIEIDDERMRIYVDTASVGNAPMFIGSDEFHISYKVEKEMSKILFDDEIYPVLDTEGAKALKELRNDYKNYQRIGASGILFLNNDVSISLLPLCGTKVEKTLSWLLHSYSFLHKGLGRDREIIVYGNFEFFKHVLSKTAEIGIENEKLLIQSIENISWDNVAKFSIDLPIKLQVRLAYDRLFDLDTTLKIIREMLDESHDSCMN
jgi:ATP-dependent Lhr-like helicase